MDYAMVFYHMNEFEFRWRNLCPVKSPTLEYIEKIYQKCVSLYTSRIYQLSGLTAKCFEQLLLLREIYLRAT